MLKIKIVLITFVMAMAVLLPAPVRAEETSGEAAQGWHLIKSFAFDIYIEDGVDVKKFNRRVSVNYIRLPKFEDYISKTQNPYLQISKKFDLILYKVQEILDMYPKNLHVSVRIYEDNKSMHADKDIPLEENTRACYVYKYNTLYINSRDIDENILAHEMAHAVIDHYFMILPPRKIQELLATYCDTHLTD